MSEATTDLEQHPCQDLCRWLPEPAPHTPRRLTCQGCGSQWDRTQAWTPVDRDGTVPEGISRASGPR
ncbi:hypothetical protein ACPPVT_14640 [Angustibacter sp. McL0619]|uniref:hypothetical protein n=1 Tax=Angustibacter sp. McL0619 TaxID=3415676 RepID=UPI003CF7341B